MSDVALGSGRAFGARKSRGVRRLLQVGISTTAICGVRDQARALERAFTSAAIEAPIIWCEADVGVSTRVGTREVAAWLSRTRKVIEETNPDAVLLHYSVFAYGPRGFPIFAPFVTRTLAAAKVPILGFLHEFAYPFGRRGWRGAAQAISHRGMLREITRHCDVVAVTTEKRVAWLDSRYWLPRRPVVFVPVVSNLPPLDGSVSRSHRTVSIGIFGFAGPDIEVTLVAEAVAALNSPENEIEIVLIGAPGADGAGNACWRQALADYGFRGAVRVTGVQPLSVIARELAEVDLVVFADRAGPDSRKSTLAAELGMGKAILAIDGPDRWERAVSERAVVVAPPEAFSAELQRIVDDERFRAAQGRRAASFYQRVMAPDVVAGELVEALALPSSGQCHAARGL